MRSPSPAPTTAGGGVDHLPPRYISPMARRLGSSTTTAAATAAMEDAGGGGGEGEGEEGTIQEDTRVFLYQELAQGEMTAGTAAVPPRIITRSGKRVHSNIDNSASSLPARKSGRRPSKK